MAISDPLVVRDSFVEPFPAAGAPNADERAEGEPEVVAAKPPPKTPRERWKKRGLVAAAVLVAPYVLYVLLFNFAFATGLFTWLVNKATPDFNMEMGSAWTLVPGRAHVTDAALRIEDSNLQFYMIIPSAVVDVDMLAFFRRTARFEKVRATGIRYWFRLKEAQADTKDAKLRERVELYPQIPGFDPFPLKPPGPKKELTKEEIEKLWSVELNDTQGTIAELWFQEYHWRGNGYVRGGFRLDPLRHLRLDPTELELHGSEIVVGKDVVASDFYASFRGTIPGLDVGTLEGPELLRVVDARLEVGTNLVGVPMRLYTDESVGVGEQGGRLEIAAGLKQGVLASGSRILLDLDMAFRKAPLEVHGGATIQARVGEEGHVDVLARVPAATALVGDAAGKTAFSIRGAQAFAKLTLPTIDQPRFDGGTVAIASLDAPDIRFLTGVLGPGVPKGGRFHTSFRGTVDTGFVARGALAASIRDLDLAFTGAHVRGALDVAGAYTSAPFLAGGKFTDAKISSTGVSLAIPGVPERTTALAGTAQELSWKGLVPTSFAARAFVTGNDARILFAPVEVDNGVEAMAARSLIGNSRFDAGGSLYAADGVIRVRIGQAVAGKVTVTGGLVQKKSGLDAAFLLRALGLNVGLGIAHGEVSVKPLKSPEWLDGELGRLGLLAPSEGASQKVSP